MASKNDPNPKIGAGHAAAMARQGLRELRAAFYPGSNVAQSAEYGLYGTRTPGEVAESRRAEELNEEPRSQLDEHMQRGPEPQSPAKDDRAIERG